MISLSREYISEKIFRRDRAAHKGDFGKVLVFAGSAGMAGAAILCGRAALRSGSGLVRFLLPTLESPLLQILQTSVPEATCVSYSEGFDFGEYSAIAAGPGLGKETIVRRILADILKRYEGKLVLDADALNMISASAELTELVLSCRAELTMTPHVGEARRLLGGASFDYSTDEGRLAAFRTLAGKYRSVIVLKGAGSLAGTSEHTFINTTGNPGMATGGSGDVLTGIIAALDGQGYATDEAAAIGTWIHGTAGDLAAQDKGEIGLISSDIAEYIPAAFKTVY